MSEPKDTRAVPREPVNLVMAIELDGVELGCGVSRDASGAGFLLLTNVDLAVGRKIVLKLFVPHEEDPRVLRASVVRGERIRPEERQVWGYRVAVALDEPPPDLQQIVQSLTKRSTGAPPAA